MSSWGPVTARTATTEVSTVIAIAHTRRGARSIEVAPNTPGAPKIRAISAAPRTISGIAAKQIARAATKISGTTSSAARPMSARASATDAAAPTAPTDPMPIRIARPGSRSGAPPLTDSASTGATVAIWRAAIAAAATAATIAVSTPIGTAYQGRTNSVRASRLAMIAGGNAPIVERAIATPATAPRAPASAPPIAASPSRSRVSRRRVPPIARSIDSCGRRWLIAMLIAI
ncbi:hypothetical protein SKPI104516_14585 [Skermania piniformis]